MLIAHMEATKKFVGITADTGPDADIAVMVASANDTRLIGSTHAPSAVVLPEGIRADMPTGGTFVPFEIAIDKVFPGIVVLSLMLPRQGGIKSILIEKSHAKGNTVAVGLSNN